MVTDRIGSLAHLHARDTSLVFVSRAPLENLEHPRRRMGWTVPWYSSAASDFNRDFGLTTDEYETFGLSVFFRDGDDVYRSYFTTQRGVETLGPAWSAAGLLLAAAAYQLLPFKRCCLSAYRPPAACIARSAAGAVGALRDGARHGLLCLGCCWALMLLLFAGGVMNLALLAAVTLLVLCEKLAPFGVRSTVVNAVALIGVGVGVLVG